jgi:hypothetical protein
MSGGSLLDKSDVQRSRWEIPHRIIATGSFTMPTTNTALTMIYAGNSGQPFTYYYSTDENADGQANDAVYVPTDVRDLNQIRFQATTGSAAATIAQQQDALDAYINKVSCLSKQRGSIMTRNTCRAPWQNVVDLSIRQPIRTLRGQNVSLQWDVFNFANLLNKNWGVIREAGDPGFPGQRLLSRVNTATVNGVVYPVYTFNKDFQYDNVRNIQSNYRMQMSVRYSF